MYIGIGIFVLLIVLLIVLVIGISLPPKHTRLQGIETKTTQKPIILIVIDSLMVAPLNDAIKSGKAPALRFFSEQGTLYPKVVSSFPTMSVCIDSTLLTGSSPNQHGIFGLSYYHPQEKRIVNFGTGAKESLHIGLKRILTDSLIHLNQRFLNPQTKTIHEEYQGPTASINAFIYRGQKKHRLTIPKFFSLFGILPPSISTRGPDLFSLGATLPINPQSRHQQLWYRYGENDQFATDELTSLIERKSLPSFTIVYFPTNDDYVHQKGTTEIKGIEKADQSLQKILNHFSSWKEAINQVTWIILGDSGQTDMIPEQKQCWIDMRKVLSSFRLTSIKKGTPSKHDQLTCCVNERMSYIYLHDPNLTFDAVIQELQKEDRLDLIAWKEEDWIKVVSGNQDGIFAFKSGDEWSDEFQQTWTIKGNEKIVDLTFKDQQIQYGNYPDVLARLAGVSEAGERVVIVTAAPGYEMILDFSPKHRGASHGSLHYMDSLVPMIVTGTHSQPSSLRLIDLKEWILSMLKTK